jgi:flagellar hook-basal body complex protein FliE
VITNRVDINQVLMQMRALKAETGMSAQDVAPAQGINPMQGTNPSQKVNFGDMMSQAINHVNAVQQNASQIATAYELGDPSIGVTDVMIASQKSSVAFEAMTQVRNKLVKAYEDIMNMPV